MLPLLFLFCDMGVVGASDVDDADMDDADMDEAIAVEAVAAAAEVDTDDVDADEDEFGVDKVDALRSLDFTPWSPDDVLGRFNVLKFNEVSVLVLLPFFLYIGIVFLILSDKNYRNKEIFFIYIKKYLCK